MFIYNSLDGVLESNKCASGEGDLHLLPIYETACPNAPKSPIQAEPSGANLDDYDKRLVINEVH
jgi:hypothetical protein